MIDCALILVNYHCEQETMDCLEHLSGLGNERPAQCIVFDNSPERGLADSPGFHQLCDRYLSSAVNIGFASAVNQAASTANAAYLVLLNPDAQPAPGCLRGLVDALQQDSTVALAGPRLLPSEGQAFLPSATRIAPNLITSLVEYTCLHRLVARDWLQRRYFADPHAGRQPCAALQGACVALRRSVFEQLQGFDNRFFFYWEDTDLSTRAHNNGFRSLYCPELSCRHEGARSAIDEDHRAAHFWRGFYAYHRKHGGVSRTLLLLLLLPTGIAVELGGLLLLNRFRGGQDQTLRRDIGVHKQRLIQQFRRLRQR